MIIATISNKRFLIDTLEEAEQLLRTLSKAKQVEYNFSRERGEPKYYVSEDSDEIEISIVADKELAEQKPSPKAAA
jgi:hypothetical protein